MSNRMDRQGARTPADLERKYDFEKSFAEIMGVATDARLTAEEAKSVATSIKETNSGITLKVQSLDEDINGADGVKAQLDLKVGTDADGNLTSKVHIGSDMLTIDTENLTLDEDGNIKLTGEVNAQSGDIGGWSIDVYGIHQAKGVRGTYAVTYSTTGTDMQTDIYEGYLFYCLEAGGIYLYILGSNQFNPYEITNVGGTPILNPLWLWRSEMFGNYKITATYDTGTV